MNIIYHGKAFRPLFKFICLLNEVYQSTLASRIEKIALSCNIINPGSSFDVFLFTYLMKNTV